MLADVRSAGGRQVRPILLQRQAAGMCGTIGPLCLTHGAPPLRTAEGRGAAQSSAAGPCALRAGGGAGGVRMAAAMANQGERAVLVSRAGARRGLGERQRRLPPYDSTAGPPADSILFGRARAGSRGMAARPSRAPGSGPSAVRGLPGPSPGAAALTAGAAQVLAVLLGQAFGQPVSAWLGGHGLLRPRLPAAAGFLCHWHRSSDGPGGVR